MKSLVEYIKFVNESSNTTVTFNINEFNDKDDIINSLNDNTLCDVDTENYTITVNVDSNKYNELKALVELLNNYKEKLLQSPERTNNEQYAQKIRKFEKEINNFEAAIEKFNPNETEKKIENEEKKDNKDEKDEKDENEEK